MHRIECPWCGVRDQAEFTYRGDATLRRPDAAQGAEAAYDFVYLRDNPMGWHVEWWHHAAGCRQWVKVKRNTMTHEIAATGKPGDELKAPGQ